MSTSQPKRGQHQLFLLYTLFVMHLGLRSDAVTSSSTSILSSVCSRTSPKLQKQAACVFPSKGLTPNTWLRECQLDTQHQRWWCPTTSNFCQDRTYNWCPSTMTTFGGSHPGKECVLPFVYNGTPFSTCAPPHMRWHRTAHHGNYSSTVNLHWCATGPVYNGSWTYCKPKASELLDQSRLHAVLHHKCFYEDDKQTIQIEKCSIARQYWRCRNATLPQITPNLDCVFPSRHRHYNLFGDFYYQCQRDSVSGRFWCPTTANYCRDKKMRYCPLTRWTEGGSDPGQPCRFPFEYNGRTYHTCTSAATPWSEPYNWCATRKGLYHIKHWSRCRHGSPQLACSFRLYNPNDRFYFNRITSAQPNGLQKLSIDHISYQCVDRQGRTVVTASPTAPLFCNTEEGVRRRCPELADTRGGNSPGESCHFPFWHEDRYHFSCISSKFNCTVTNEPGNYLWCSTSVNFTRNPTWTSCRHMHNMSSIRSHNGQCRFPYRFNGRLVTFCLKYGNLRWCSLTDNFDRDGLWKSCEAKDVQGNQEFHNNSVDNIRMSILTWILTLLMLSILIPLLMYLVCACVLGYFNVSQLHLRLHRGTASETCRSFLYSTTLCRCFTNIKSNGSDRAAMIIDDSVSMLICHEEDEDEDEDEKNDHLVVNKA